MALTTSPIWLHRLAPMLRPRSSLRRSASSTPPEKLLRGRSIGRNSSLYGTGEKSRHRSGMTLRDRLRQEARSWCGTPGSSTSQSPMLAACWKKQTISASRIGYLADCSAPAAACQSAWTLARRTSRLHHSALLGSLAEQPWACGCLKSLHMTNAPGPKRMGLFMCTPCMIDSLGVQVPFTS